ncbi:MAG: hypothetical protein KKC28_14800 [Verrucomicrobia bacterium]|nr:hypothetical protein [Verrucomicrobiota bacterium]
MKIKYYLSLFRKAAQLDIFDLNYEFSSEVLKAGDLSASGSYHPGLFIRMISFWWHMFKAFLDILFLKSLPVPEQAIIFWALGKNDADSMRPVASRLAKGFLIDRADKEHQYFPWFGAYAISILYWPLVMVQFLRSNGYRRRSFTQVFDHYWIIYGLYITSKIWIRSLRPRAMIFSNLLFSYARVLQKAAREEGVICVYMQHASLMDDLPAFNCDYVLLEGRDSLEKAAKTGARHERFFLIGTPKHDAYVSQVNTHRSVLSIGICTNGADLLPIVEALLAQLRLEFPAMKIIVRQHSSDRRVKAWRDLAQKYLAEFSDSREVMAFDFLKNVDAVVAGDSNILLESALMNVVPLYYDFPQKHLDWLGFERHGLVEYFSEPDQVCHCIKEISRSKPSVRAKAKLYCATVGTHYDGHSGELAAALIQSLVSGAPVDRSIWKRIPDIGLEAYELV